MKINILCRILGMSAALMLGPLLPAAVYSPRVVSEHTADAYSMKTFARFNRWQHLEGDAKAYAVYEYLVNERTGIYPMGVPAIEGDEELIEFSAVCDPVKMLNVYPIGHCGALGPTAAGIMQDMGIGQARTLVLPGWNHVASEVFYDGGWHYIDLDVRAVFRRPDGTLASMAEAQQDPTLWDKPNSALFFPLDQIKSVQQTYRTTAVGHRYGMGPGGHTMDYMLRQGETFTRWWQPQGGRWNHHVSYATKPFPRNIIEQAPRGPKSKHASFTVHTHGNGRFVYQPNLTAASTDFDDGVFAAHNVQPTATGLSLKQAGLGYAVFEVRTPYVIAPIVGDIDTSADDCDASVIEIDAANAVLSLSLDNGLTWRALGAATGVIDLTRHVSGGYGYLLKIELQGKPNEAVVRSLKITTWVQLHPASLPALRGGRNLMSFIAGDHYGLPTRVVEIRSNAGDPGEFLKYLVSLPTDYDPARRTSRVQGEIVAKVDAPPNTAIAWFSAGASFRTHQFSAASSTSNSIEFAIDEPRDFKEIYRAKIPIDQSHWHYNADTEVRLEKPARTVYVRYIGNPALNNIRIYAHCIENKRRDDSPVTITQAWHENGQPKSKQVTLLSAGNFEIVTGAAPDNDFIEIAVASRTRSQAQLQKNQSEKPAAQASGPATNDWIGPMKSAHKKFQGLKGTFAQFGDSITASRAFWFTLQHNRKNAPPQMRRAFSVVNEYMAKDCWDRKGPRYGNEGRMTIRWAHDNIDTWLAELDPEVAVIMFGTNDLNDLALDEYESKLRQVIQRCLDNGTVVIASTIPPRHGFVEKSAQFAAAVRRIAANLNVPLIDYYAEILERQPEDWDGALEKFSQYEGYDVPALISRDGVHPSNPQQYASDYSEQALKVNGYSLRNYLTLLKYAEAIDTVLKPPNDP